VVTKTPGLTEFNSCTKLLNLLARPTWSFYMPQPLDVEEHIVAAIRRIMRAVDLYSRYLETAYGLTGPQLATLREAARLHGASASVLARAVNLSQPTLTGILDRLERRGLVTRSRSGTDRRSVVITATNAGHAMLATAPPLLQDHFRQELAKLQEWEQTAMLATLQRVAAMMDAKVHEAAPALAAPSDVTMSGEPAVGLDDVRPVPVATPTRTAAGSETVTM
jgi:DNA-binding MarR family transcriptional regulator